MSGTALTRTMEYQEKLQLLFWDKGALTLVGIVLAAVITYFFNIRAKREERAASALQEHMQRRREFALRILDGEIALLEQKLEIFLWPLSLFLGIDSAVWQKIPGLVEDTATLPTKTGKLVETQLLLPNHFRAVELIERNFHLVAEENDLLNPMIDYVQHVAIYRALRESKSGVNPVDVGAPFPEELPMHLQRILERTMAELSALKSRRAEQANVLTR